jgi:hypothetical protein
MRGRERDGGGTKGQHEQSELTDWRAETGQCQEKSGKNDVERCQSQVRAALTAVRAFANEM